MGRGMRVVAPSGVVGRVVDWNGGKGWVTIRWPDGKQADFYRPTVEHGMRYLCDCRDRWCPVCR